MHEVKIYIDLAMTILALVELVKLVLIIAENAKSISPPLSQRN